MRDGAVWWFLVHWSVWSVVGEPSDASVADFFDTDTDEGIILPDDSSELQVINNVSVDVGTRRRRRRHRRTGGGSLLLFTLLRSISSSLLLPISISISTRVLCQRVAHF